MPWHGMMIGTGVAAMISPIARAEHSSFTQRGQFPQGDHLSVTDCPQRLEDRLANWFHGM
jgi:hypothetical protein